jgi:hypothetical protein
MSHYDRCRSGMLGRAAPMRMCGVTDGIVRSPNDLIYVAVSIILLLSAGIEIFVASQIVVALGLLA